MVLALTQIEYDYLISADYIDKQIKDLLPKSFSATGTIALNMDEENVLDLYEQLQDKLVSSGFDENYNVTAEGSIIESLMDKITDAEE